MTLRLALVVVVLVFSSAQASEKPRLLQTLLDFRNELQVGGGGFSPDDEAKLTSLKTSLDWFERTAAAWTPKTADEGLVLRESFERMRSSIRDARANRNVGNLLSLIDDDLKDKVAYCRENGLSSRRQVRVVTKRDAVAEIKGLEVLYLEKFLESDSNAKPQQFRGFSSPAVDDLVPGRYLFWAKEPGQTGKNGARKEARVTAGMPSDPIEVLAP